jgi:hypothetical protein
MPNQKISELTAIVTVDTSLDVLPIVDTSANTTKKISPTALKTALALDNVNNTSDANKPVSTAQQDALNAKVTANAAIIAATKTKITYDAKGLVTAGDILDAADMPTGINAANIGTGVVSSTEFGYLDGVTSAIQTQLDSKQTTLVSGTNIKTLNNTSLLGSGNITLTANPSGVSGAIQFSNGSAFASDAANLFWDDVNNRLGIGLNNPTATGHLKGSGSTSATTSLLVQNSAGATSLQVTDDGVIQGNSGTQLRYRFGGSSPMGVSTRNGAFTIGVIDGGFNQGMQFNVNSSSGKGYIDGWATFDLVIGNNGNPVQIGTDSSVASAQLTVNSTTKGFMPPRMTTTQRDNIVGVAAGLIIYNSVTNKLQCYNGSTWNDLF